MNYLKKILVGANSGANSGLEVKNIGLENTGRLIVGLSEYTRCIVIMERIERKQRVKSE